MNSYTVKFESDSHYGETDIEAANAHDALLEALRLVESRQVYHEVIFQPYDSPGYINEIEVWDNEHGGCEDALATWQSDDLALANAAPALRDALQALVERERVDAAQSGLSDDEMTWLDDARRALARAKGGAQ